MLFLLDSTQPRIVLKLFLFLSRFQPQYSYKIVLIEKKEWKQYAIQNKDLISTQRSMSAEISNLELGRKQWTYKNIFVRRRCDMMGHKISNSGKQHVNPSSSQ